MSLKDHHSKIFSFMNIKVQNLAKSYDSQKVVNHISFEVKAGEVLGFLGPNGAGKSTTMKMITHYIAMGEGDIFIGGRSVKEEGEVLKKYIGYLPENNPLYVDMPVIDYLEFCAMLQGIPSEKVGARIKEMIKLCGLNIEKHKRIGELSKGYRQRVGLAQAMIHDPAILILDEPTSGLDPNQIVEIRKLIKKLGREKTIVLSTHILSEVEATCDRILIINQGEIVADETPENLRKKAQSQEILKVSIEDGKPADIVKALKGINEVASVATTENKKNYFEVQSKPNQSSKRAIFQMCVNNNWVLTELFTEETSLEDVFRRLTRE